MVIQMLSRTTIIIIGLIGLFLLFVIGIGLWSRQSKPSVPSCNCPAPQVCVNGQCLNPSPCQGISRVVPAGQHCAVDTLVCDPAAKSWKCNGECIAPWFGTLC